MKKYSWKSLLILMFFLLSSGYLLYVSLAYSYLGMELEKQNGEWVIENLQSQGWAARNGVPLGATIIEVDGKPTGQHYTVSLIGELEMAESFKIKHDGSVEVYNDLNGLSFQHWMLYVILPVVFLIVTLAITQFLYKNMPARHSANILIMFFMTIALGYMSNSAAIRGDFYGSLMNAAMFLFAPVLLIHFLHGYFSELGVKWYSKKIHQVLYIIISIVCLFKVYYLLNLEYPAALVNLPAILLFFLIVLLFVLIFTGYKKYRSTRYGPMFKYINLGMVTAFLPYILLYLIPGLLLEIHIITLDIAAMFLIALPVTFIYLVTSQRLMDITFVMGRIRYYALISFIPSMLIMISGAVMLDFTVPSIRLFQLFLFIEIIMVSFLSLKEVLDFRLQRRLFAAKYSYQESMHRLSQDMKNESNVVDLLRRLRLEVKNVLNVKELHIYSKNFKTQTYCVYKEVPKSTLSASEKHIGTINPNVGSLIETNEGFGVILGYSLNKLTVLWCTGKKDFTSLNLDEKTYLQTIAHNTNIALENLTLIEDLVKELKDLKNDQTQQYPTWLSRLLFTIAENQRKQLSIDLHDTVLQEQLYLYRKIDDLTESRQVLSPGVKNELKNFKESLLDSIHLIRETCNELRPAFIEELGLVQSLRNLIHQYQLRSNFTVYFSEEDFTIDLDQERVMAIYRIVQELLSNAMKHSQAKAVHLYLYSDMDGVHLSYADDGIGMDYSVKRNLYSHIGLSGIEQRINGLNGQISVETAPDEGFKMRICFPLSMKEGVLQ
ncbi:sensor histidine kinase [Thalassobacillus pellis]|uniref:sensor histidine kinase n=1 Tax=Thalassobacillus pellis TaxID=748008 RepID=UPI00196152A3|nr:sensor histidine kinase [Thalassobacillus pellis]MBM7555035.1 two-component system sensor histidine kinase ComP [Thalassobacillus pellis]